MKRNRIIIGIIVFVVLLGVGGGYAIYANDMQMKIESTQKAYHSIILPGTDEYNVIELAEFNTILEEKEKAFIDFDVISLNNIQNKINTLDKRVLERIETEKIEKLYAEKKDEVEAINIVEAANQDETNIFHSRKAEALQLVADRVAIEVIDTKIAELKQTNVDIEARKAVPASSNSSTSTTRATYYDDGDTSDEPVSGGGDKPSTTPDVPSSGGYVPPAPERPTPPVIGGTPCTPKPGDGNVCA